MKGKDQFIEWLRERVLQNPQEPPAGAWQEISDALDLEDSWEKIGEDLEINSVWNRIDSRLDILNRFKRTERLTQGISVAVLIAFMLAVLILPPAQENYIADYSGKPEFSHTAKQETGKTETPLPNAAKDINLPNTKEEMELGKDLEYKENTISKSQISSGTTVAVNQSGQDISFRGEARLGSREKGAVSLEKAPDSVLLKEDMIIAEGHPLKGNLGISAGEIASGPFAVKTVYPERTEQKEERYPSSYAGAGTAVKWSWFINDKTLYAMERNSLLTAAPRIQTDFWLLYGHKIKPRLFLQADAYLKEVTGQKYQEYHNGTFGNVEDRLTYQSLALSLSWVQGQKEFGRFPAYSRIFTGLYGGRLLSAEEIILKESSIKTGEYSKTHLGLLAGYEYDIFLSPGFILTYGIRSRMDMLNIYSGSENMPKALRRTRALALDFSISFKYVLKK